MFRLKDKMFTAGDLVRLLIPLIVEQILTSLMGTADTLMVARVGEAAVSGVSNVDAINNLMLMVFTALATGGTITCAQYLGAQDRKSANLAARQVLLCTFAIACLCCVICVVFRRIILQAVFGGVEESVMDAAMVYLLITGLSYPFMGAYYASAALYRAAGNSRLPMVVSVICNLLNIVGNALFLFVLRWGVAGAALATTLSRVVQCAVMLILHHRPGQTIVLDHYLKIRPDYKLIKTVLRIGVPTGIENGMFQLGRLMVQSTVATLPTTQIAAQAVVNTLEYFSSTPSMAVGLGLVTVVGQCMGAGRKKEAREYTMLLTIISEIALLITEVFVWFSVTPVSSFSALTPESAELVRKMILFIVITKPIVWPLAFIPMYGMRAAGDVRFCMLVSVLSMWFCRIVFCVVLIRFLHFGILGVWIAMLADWTDRAIWSTARYISGKWMTKTVIETQSDTA